MAFGQQPVAKMRSDETSRTPHEHPLLGSLRRRFILTLMLSRMAAWEDGCYSQDDAYAASRHYRNDCSRPADLRIFGAVRDALRPGGNDHPAVQVRCRFH